MITVLSPQRQVRLQALAYRGQPVWSASLDYDEGGRLARERHTVVAAGHDRSWSYAYDARDRLVGARRNGSAADVDTSWFAWNEDGSLAARHVNGATARPRIARDASGLPHMAEGFALSYGPNRRLVRVQEGDDVVAHYRHNAFGHRIAKRSRHGDVDYFYLDNRLVAERRNDAVLETAGPPHADTGNEPLQPLVTRRYLYAHHALVGVIDYVDGELYYAHSDPVGAPRVLTDATRTIRWLADYQPTGAAERVSGDLTLNLRLPGQVLDEETGWHDNVLRTYAPRLGHYLEPDPLGPVPGNQALGYADQQPRRHIDPLGLILFAFDGTRNNAQSQSNVWKMSQYYLDGPVYYHSGPGNPYYVDWNAITAWQASQIIDTQWLSLLNALGRADGGREHIPIDIIGFSRGAALARHFANLVGQHVDHGLFSYHDSVRGLVTACVDLRFMGLFDTVAQFGLAGSRNSNYDLSIASAWQWVAHAVALHERRWLFPLTSVQHGLSENTVEAPFIGAHADIGGGALMLDDGTMGSRGDLSDVALNWMIWQARAASLRFGDVAAHDAEISDPILHDLRSPALRSVQDGDRRVDGPGGTLMYGYQHDHPGLGSAQRQDVEALIARVENWRNSAGDEVGHVDMQAYALWLQRELGWAALPA
jgi:RHS repeat-associated protein